MTKLSATSTGKSGLSNRWVHCGILLALTLFFTSCSEDKDLPGEGPDTLYGWTRLPVAPEWVTAIELTPTHLAFSGGVSGVYVQSPPLSGPFDFAGSNFPELYLGQLWYGVFRVAVVGDSLFRGFRGPVNHVPVECGLAGLSYQTASCSEGITPRQLNDMIPLPTGEILLCTSGALYRRAANSSMWSAKVTRTFIKCAFSRGSVRRIYMAYQGQTMAGTLYRTENQGDSWQLVTPAMPQGIQAAEIISLSTSSAGDTILAATNTNLLISMDGAASFRLSRAIPEGSIVFLDPGPLHRWLAVADSLYSSTDMGATWEVTPIPGRRLSNEPENVPANTAAAVDWTSGYIVVGRLGNDASEVWWLSID